MQEKAWIAAVDVVVVVCLSLLLWQDKVPTEAFLSLVTAMVVARGVAGKGDKAGGGVPPSAMSGIVLLGGLLLSLASRGRSSSFAALLGLGLTLGSCTGERPACAPTRLAAIEAAYVEEVVAACGGQAFEDCAARPAIEARYAIEREEWARCQ